MSDPASLQNLQDIIEPAAVSFWPPAAGIWLIMALALLWACVGVAVLWNRWRQNAYRRAGMQELQKIRHRLRRDETTKAIQELAALLKRVALTAFPRDRVASLSGDNWLAFLDATMGGGTFSAGPGNLLAASAYRRSDFSLDVSDRQIDELFNLAGIWIKQHQSTVPVEAPAFRSE
jgi:hypothetical protein